MKKLHELPQHVQRWGEIVFRIVHRGFDFLGDPRNKDLLLEYRRYLGWKIKTTLGESKNGEVAVDNRTYFYDEIFSDLENRMFEWVHGNRPKLLNLNIEQVWAKFNNSVFNYLQYKYRHKVPRESQFPVCDGYQNPSNYDDTDLADHRAAASTAFIEKIQKKKEIRHGEIQTLYSLPEEIQRMDKNKFPDWDIIFQFWMKHREQLKGNGWNYDKFYNAASNSDGVLLKKIISDEQQDFNSPIWRKENGKQKQALPLA